MILLSLNNIAYCEAVSTRMGREGGGLSIIGHPGGNAAGQNEDSGPAEKGEALR